MRRCNAAVRCDTRSCARTVSIEAAPAGTSGRHAIALRSHPTRLPIRLAAAHGSVAARRVALRGLPRLRDSAPRDHGCALAKQDRSCRARDRRGPSQSGDRCRPARHGPPSAPDRVWDRARDHGGGGPGAGLADGRPGAAAVAHDHGDGAGDLRGRTSTSGWTSPGPTTRSRTSGTPSTGCSPGSRAPSTPSASSSPTPRTSCAPRWR